MAHSLANLAFYFFFYTNGAIKCAAQTAQGRVHATHVLHPLLSLSKNCRAHSEVGTKVRQALTRH